MRHGNEDRRREQQKRFPVIVVVGGTTISSNSIPANFTRGHPLNEPRRIVFAAYGKRRFCHAGFSELRRVYCGAWAFIVGTSRPPFARPVPVTMYQAYQTHTDLTQPMKEWARRVAPLLHETGFKRWALIRSAAAACEVLALARVTHHRRPFGIDSVHTSAGEAPVREEVALTTPFATLLRFRKDGAPAQPKVLLVAPMSGHFATLLRDTARTLLAHHDVYITDWHNAREIPAAAGRFGLDDMSGNHRVRRASRGRVTHCRGCVSRALPRSPRSRIMSRTIIRDARGA